MNTQIYLFRKEKKNINDGKLNAEQIWCLKDDKVEKWYQDDYVLWEVVGERLYF